MRLVDADEFKDVLSSYGCLDAAALLDDCPTAYNVCKIVEKLSELNDNEFTYSKVISIIKAGGVNE